MGRLSTEIKIGRKKVIKLGLLLLVSIASAVILRPWYHDSDRASIILVSIFSMLSGFLLAVMAVVANDKTLRGDDWKEQTYYLEQISTELLKHQLTFYVYLTTLLFTFAASVSGTWFTCAQKAAEYGLVFFATMGVILSFRLPAELKKRHEIALQNSIKKQREEEANKAMRRGESQSE